MVQPTSAIPTLLDPGPPRCSARKHRRQRLFEECRSVRGFTHNCSVYRDDKTGNDRRRRAQGRGRPHVAHRTHHALSPPRCCREPRPSRVDHARARSTSRRFGDCPLTLQRESRVPDSRLVVGTLFSGRTPSESSLCAGELPVGARQRRPAAVPSGWRARGGRGVRSTRRPASRSNSAYSGMESSRGGRERARRAEGIASRRPSGTIALKNCYRPAAEARRLPPRRKRSSDRLPRRDRLPLVASIRVGPKSDRRREQLWTRCHDDAQDDAALDARIPRSANGGSGLGQRDMPFSTREELVESDDLRLLKVPAVQLE